MDRFLIQKLHYLMMKKLKETMQNYLKISYMKNTVLLKIGLTKKRTAQVHSIIGIAATDKLTSKVFLRILYLVDQ